MSPRMPSSTTVAQIRQLSDAVSELMTAVTDPSIPVPQTPRWTLAEVATHLLTVAVRYCPEAGDQNRWPTQACDVAALNEAEIAAVPARELPSVLTGLRTAVSALPSGDGVDAAGSVPVIGGFEVTPTDLYGLMLGEFVVHGHDIASAVRQPWPVEPEVAAEAIRAVTTILPAWVDPQRTAGMTCTIALRVRGDRRYVWEFTDGHLVVNPPDPRRVDVTISARPVALLMVFYGRRSPRHAILTGQVRAWGRTPRLALSCHESFRSP